MPSHIPLKTHKLFNKVWIQHQDTSHTAQTVKGRQENLVWEGLGVAESPTFIIIEMNFDSLKLTQLLSFGVPSHLNL